MTYLAHKPHRGLLYAYILLFEDVAGKIRVLQQILESLDNTYREAYITYGGKYMFYSPSHILWAKQDGPEIIAKDHARERGDYWVELSSAPALWKLTVPIPEKRFKKIINIPKTIFKNNIPKTTPPGGWGIKNIPEWPDLFKPDVSTLEDIEEKVKLNPFPCSLCGTTLGDRDEYNPDGSITCWKCGTRNTGN